MKKSITMGIVLSAVLASGTAFAVVQDKAQQKCINTLNKGMLKVTKAQLKADGKCIKDFANGKNMDADTCYNTNTKVDDAQAKLCEEQTKKCTTVPTLGPTGCGTINNYAEYNGSEFASEILNDANPDSGIVLCATSKPACKCQTAVLKSASKLLSTIQKEFNGCKKNGLKNKTTPFDDVTDLNACLGADPKNKISKELTKLNTAITKKCTDKGVAVPFALGDCMGLTGMALGTCLEREARCAACIIAVASDDLTLDCDAFDDANDENNSCNDDF